MELSKPVFYYARNGQGHPIVTVCLLVMKVQDEGAVICRGVSICSPIEPIKKQEGRKRALKRAMHAMYTQYMSDYPIKREEAIDQIDSTELDPIVTHKSMYDCDLTKYENDLLSKLKLI